MNRLAKWRHRNFGVEQQRAAIGVPEAEFRVHENAKGRRPQPFGAHRPLLERQIGPVIGRNRPRPDLFGDRPDHLTRPCVERVFQISALLPPPGQEVRPWLRLRPVLPAVRIWRGGQRVRSGGMSPRSKLKPPRGISPWRASSAAAVSRNAGRPAVTPGFFAASACASARRSWRRNAATAPLPRAKRRPR